MRDKAKQWEIGYCAAYVCTAYMYVGYDNTLFCVYDAKRPRIRDEDAVGFCTG